MSIKITKFNGGIVNDPRDPRENVVRMATNFDIFTDDYRIKPYRSGEVGNDNQTADKIQNFCIAQFDSTPTYALYGLGISDTGTNRAKVFYKDLTTGAAYDLDDGTWNATANPESAANNSGLSPECFVYYKNQGKIYMVDVANDKIMVYDPDGGTAWEESQALTATYIAQGIVHSKDDILYIPYDNKIASKNGSGSWTTAALTLPEGLRIRSICEYGNYIAIACSPVTGFASGFGGSVVYLWDRDSTLATLSDLIQWGDEILYHIEEVNGSLVGISVITGTARFDSRVVFRYLSVSSAIKFLELTTSSTLVFGTQKQKVNGRLNFLMGITLNGTNRHGVWSIGGTPGNFSLVHERTTYNDTTFASYDLKGFFFVGDYCFISYQDASNAIRMSKTESSTTYSQNSIIETTINPKMALEERTRKKTLKAVALHYESLPAGATAKLEYRVDGGSWTEIFTASTAGDIVTESAFDVNKHQFTSGREYEFRITSAGGAVIDCLEYDYELLNTLL